MNIEVTSGAFHTIFKGMKPSKSETKETHRKLYYYSKKLDMSGFKIYNHVSMIYNYYLTDINA